MTIHSEEIKSKLLALKVIDDSESREEEYLRLLRDLSARLDLQEIAINRLKEHNDELQSLIKTNPDTNLPIFRVLFQDMEQLVQSGKSFWLAQVRLDTLYQRIKSYRDRSKALLFITTLRIKKIVGDCLYQSDRLDEFYILQASTSSEGEVRALLIKMEKCIELAHEGPAGDIHFGSNIGFTLATSRDDRASEIMSKVEIALNFGIKTRKRVTAYSGEIGAQFDRQLQIEEDLHRAILNGFGGFHMAYQAFVDHHGQIKGSESLIRWEHPVFGMVPPPSFIPVAERNGDIRLLGRWILYQSILQMGEWLQAGYKDIFVSVNLSPLQFGESGMVQGILDILTSAGVPGTCLKLEITEGAIMADPNDAVRKLTALRNAGIKISIDDFGTGYSSLNYLRKLPIDTLKIDKSFVDDITVNQQNREIVRAILAMATSLGIETLAEGVESFEQKELLFSEGCQFIQGFYYSKPVEAALFTAYLAKGGVLPNH